MAEITVGEVIIRTDERRYHAEWRPNHGSVTDGKTGVGNTAAMALRNLADILDGKQTTDAVRTTQDLVRDSSNQRQVGGGHYKSMAIEHWDYAFENNLDYFQGQITKYVSRWKTKNGLQDLIKAQHFLEKYIEASRRRSENGLAPPFAPNTAVLPPEAPAERRISKP